MQINTKDNNTILSIRKFLGLNENPDGDTAIKNGELSEMRNFRITQDTHLQIRPGSQTVVSLADALAENGGDPDTAKLDGLWHGYVGRKPHLLAAYGGKLWDVSIANDSARMIGTATAEETTFFGFGGNAYLLNGHEYLRWNGGDATQFETVEGYVPLVQMAASPSGQGGITVEPINRLTPKRRAQFSPDGTAKTFQLPEKNLSGVYQVTVGGSATSAYTANTAAGTVTFNSAPASGTNTVEIAYTAGTSQRGDVLGMRFSELYNGSTDSRVFLYGDGTNRAIYSGIPYGTGTPSAEYFPDLYEIGVGESNTPLTALIRHYSRLMAYKPGSAYVIQYGTLGLADSSSTPAFYCQPVNRQFGNDAPGQAKLLENDPLTIDTGSVYQWRSGGYSNYVSANENNARRISDRVVKSIRKFDAEKLKTANLKNNHEFWFLQDGRALIYGYVTEAWYLYENLPFDRVLEIGMEIYGGGNDGRIVRFSRDYRNDDGEDIDAYAATGAMDFDKDWLLKYSPMIFLALQPETGARISVTAESNRRSDYPKKEVSFGLATFSHVDFAHFSFNTNRKPQVKRVKIKVKKATFYRLIYSSCSSVATATVIETDVKLRYAGNVK